MRRPRVRFTVGTFLFLTALVAANFWAFGRFYESQRVSTAPVDHRVLPVTVGVIPLCNVVVMGAWFFVTGRLRRGGGDARPSPPWVAFFGAQFLMLGWLMSVYMPDEVRRLDPVFETATERTVEAWAAVFGEPDMTASWTVAATLLLGAIVSGPPLVLSWFGRLLAVRCARTLPPARFWLMAGLVTFGFACAGLAVCLTPRPIQQWAFTPELIEVGFDFRVVDETTNRPIARAFVCLTDPFYQEELKSTPRDFTDRDGRAKLTDVFEVVGEQNAFTTFGQFSPWGRWLEVSAAGYVTRRVSLTEVFGPSADPVSLQSGTVSLARGDTDTLAGPFRDIAGGYTDGGQGFGGRWLVVEPDGRFAWCMWGCVPPDLQEYGYLKRDGAWLDLVPVPRPDGLTYIESEGQYMVIPGGISNLESGGRYLVVPWGDRLYLCPFERNELMAFCRSVLRPDGRPGGYLRGSDEKRLQWGLPRLPLGVWVAWLAEEVSLDNEDGGLRFVLDFMRSGSRLKYKRWADRLRSPPVVRRRKG